jgi:hypothetical protein
MKRRASEFRSARYVFIAVKEGFLIAWSNVRLDIINLSSPGDFQDATVNKEIRPMAFEDDLGWEYFGNRQ